MHCRTLSHALTLDALKPVFIAQNSVNSTPSNTSIILTHVIYIFAEFDILYL